MTLKGTAKKNISEHKPCTYLSLVAISFFPSIVSIRSTNVLTTDVSTVGGNYADFFMKNVIMSMGRGNTIVEFFSAEIVFKVLRIQTRRIN